MELVASPPYHSTTTFRTLSNKTPSTTVKVSFFFATVNFTEGQFAKTCTPTLVKLAGKRQSWSA